MSADKYPSIFSCQMEAIVYTSHESLDFLDIRTSLRRVALNENKVTSVGSVIFHGTPRYTIREC